MSIKNKTILFVANNPGGANAILPIYKKLNKKNKCEVISTLNSYFIFQNIPNNNLYDIVKNNYSLNRVINILIKVDPDIIVLGSSEPVTKKYGNLEQLFVKASNDLQIKSVTVLDHWVGYTNRFLLYKQSPVLL